MRIIALAVALTGPLLLAAPAVAAPAPVTRVAPTPVTRAASVEFASTKAGLRKQHVTVTVPAGWTLTLDGRAPEYDNTVLVPEGFYTQDSPKKITFTPAVGYLGTATPVTFRLTGPAGQTRTGTYTATVTRPKPPRTPDLTSSGKARAQQQVSFPLPAGGTHGLAHPSVPQGELALAGISAIAHTPGRPTDPTLIAATGFLMFTPHRGVTGKIQTIEYTITDAYGQTTAGTWTPTVTSY